MSGRAVASALALACCVAIVSCDRANPKASKSAGSASPDSVSLAVSSPPVSPSPDTVPLGVHRPSELVEAATEVIQFLRGDVGFERIRLADTVALYLGPEEGGTRRKVTREMLRNPSNWKVRSAALRFVYSFAPPKRPAELTTRVGHHLVCGRETPLSSSSKELAQLPHVGTMLRYGTDSCLQSWNLTLVFDPEQRPPTVIAAVYDQYEW